ncbi:MAG: hypothetical protein PHO08_11720 [Methylococcales bacterium]|nr:hypothetical protein [Methylococcales bacterium]MDD5631258.1 hypothetical protein [Methylococcales bacterium]
MKATRMMYCTILTSLWLSGCATFSGTPQEPIDLTKLTSTFATELQKIQGSTTTIDKLKRDDYISKALTIMDFNYSTFVNGLGTQKRTKDMVTDFLVLSMNLAGTAVGAAETKTILAAISAGITGTNSALDKNFFYDMALPSLIAQMNADRTEVYLKILSGMQRETSGKNAYLWAQAVRDLVDYFNAGTLQHAASSIGKDAGARQTASQIEINNILMVPQVAKLSDIPLREEINRALNNITEKNSDKVKDIFVPLSNALSHLPDCKALENKADGNVSDIKIALQLCIQSVSGDTQHTFQEDNTKIAQKFKEAGIMQ